MMKDLLDRVKTALIAAVTDFLRKREFDDDPRTHLNSNLEACVEDVRGRFRAIERFDPIPVFQEFQGQLQNLSIPKEGESLVKTTIANLRSSVETFLVSNWEFAQYFDPFTYKEGFFGHRYAALASKVNIGTRSATTI
eukprot:Selendium_serpulae@DN10198_c0_g1_i1.p1